MPQYMELSLSSLARSLARSPSPLRTHEWTNARTHAHEHTVNATRTRASVRPLSPIWMHSGPKFASVRACGRSCRVVPDVKDTIPCTLIRKNAHSNNHPTPSQPHRDPDSHFPAACRCMHTVSFSCLRSNELAVEKEGHFTESAAHTTTVLQSTTVVIV